MKKLWKQKQNVKKFIVGGRLHSWATTLLTHTKSASASKSIVELQNRV
jgi:hypothetical protein